LCLTLFAAKFAGINPRKMAETLGSLCDKLTIVKLKQYHTEDAARLQSLSSQEKQLQEEINGFVKDAVDGNIPADRLTFSANKVFKKEGNELARVNCDLWHEQEKVYEFEKVEAAEKDIVVKKLAVLNLERNKCIDAIDRQFQSMVTGKNQA
jgi:ribosomal protein L44E